MYEVLLRPQEVSSVPLPSIDSAISKLRKAEIVGEERRLRQIESARMRNKRKRDEAAGIGPVEGGEMLDSDGTMAPPPKKRKEMGSNDVDNPAMEEGELENNTPQNEPEPSKTRNGHLDHPYNQSEGSPSPQAVRTLHVAHPYTEVRGHTSYLTFAVLLPYHYIARTQAGSISASAQEPQLSADVAPLGSSAGNITITTDAHADFSAYDEYFRNIPDDVRRDLRVPQLDLTCLMDY